MHKAQPTILDPKKSLKSEKSFMEVPTSPDLMFLTQFALSMIQKHA